MNKLTLKRILVIAGLTILIGIISCTTSAPADRPAWDGLIYNCPNMPSGAGENDIESEYALDHAGWPLKFVEIKDFNPPRCTPFRPNYQLSLFLADLIIWLFEAIAIYVISKKLLNKIKRRKA